MSERIKVALVSLWASRLGGGVFEAMVTHANVLSEAGFEPVVFSFRDEHSAADSTRFDGAAVRLFDPLGPGSIGFSPALRQGLADERVDIVHLHGIWTALSHAAGSVATAQGLPYVISPHGMLEKWIVQRRRLKKWIAAAAYEHRSWKRASLLHALTDSEAGDIRRETGRDAIAVIPNAVTLPADDDNGIRSDFVYIGRIHPKKNLLALVAAWKKAIAGGRRGRLVLAGWGDPQSVQALEAAVSGVPGGSATFVGPVYGADKDALLARARFVVLPSFSEGLPMAILEAWAAGTPVIMTDFCNLPEGFEAGAAIRSGVDAESVAGALDTAFDLDEAGWAQMSRAARGLAARRYSTSVIAAQWKERYLALLGRAAEDVNP